MPGRPPLGSEPPLGRPRFARAARPLTQPQPGAAARRAGPGLAAEPRAARVRDPRRQHRRGSAAGTPRAHGTSLAGCSHPAPVSPWDFWQLLLASETARPRVLMKW